MALNRTTKILPWTVAAALMMQQLDTTIVNTAIPALAENFKVTPLSLKVIVASYVMSFAVFIPISGWLADKFGTRKIFMLALAIFTLSSIACGLSFNTTSLVLARMVQGFGAALMMPVGRLTIIRSYPKNELLAVMNFIIVPALIGPLLGPLIGGLIVDGASWRYIFFINAPIGMLALSLAWRYFPDYRDPNCPPLDWQGLLLFASAVGILSWLLEVFAEHRFSTGQMSGLLLLSITLFGVYVYRALRIPHPLLRLDLFRIRSFSVSVLGGFVTRLGISGMPFLLPLLYQLVLGLSASQSGLLLMPAAAAAMGMKLVSAKLLARYSYKQVLIVNTVLIALTMLLFTTVQLGFPYFLIVLFSLAMGFSNSLQFTCMNTLAYADVSDKDASQASTLASSMQQLSMSFGLASGSLFTSWFLNGLPQSDIPVLTTAIHHAFMALAAITLLSSLSFWKLRPTDGDTLSKTSKARDSHAGTALE